jgi:hypothetical protein
MKYKTTNVIALATTLSLGLIVAAHAQNRAAGPPISPAQHRATLQGVAASKAAAAKNAHEAATAYNRAYRAARAGDVVIRQAAKAVPYGGAAYGAGKAVGHVIATYPVTIQKNVPPLPHYGYQAPRLPAPVMKALPSLPAGPH